MILVILIGFIIRPIVSDQRTKKYFFPALILKIVGAIGVGVLYQYYYSGGDTFTYFSHGAAHVWQAFLDSPSTAGRLIFAENDYSGDVWEYARRIWVYRDSPSYMVVRLAGLFSIFTFGSYIGTAILFAVFSFSGLWAMFYGFQQLHPTVSRNLAFAILFIPSAVFWGSGILKDTLTLGAIGWATWAVIEGLVLRKKVVVSVLVLFLALFMVYSIKKYVVLCYVPSVLIWVYLLNITKVKPWILRLMIAPFVLLITIGSGYLAIDQISREDPRYALDRLGETAMITAMDIGYWTGKDAGSRYTLGTPDQTLTGMLLKAPAAINVTLFRPYLWEVGNPLMAIASIESLIILVLSIYIVIKTRSKGLSNLVREPSIVFCITLSLTFAFAVGVSTYNFGTLVRYKIPLMPFYLVALVLVLYQSRKSEALNN